MARIDREKLGELLSGYMDGELDPRERRIIERVLREDESARQLLADLRRTTQAVSSLPRHAAPSSIRGDIEAALERSALLQDLPEPRPHQTRDRLSWTARLAMAAMVGLVVVTGWWFTSEQTRQGPKGKTELARREGQDADAARENDEPRSTDKSALSGVLRARDVSTTSAAGDAGRTTGPALATVEQQLAAGVDPSSLRSQAFTVEPLRLRLTVGDRSQREALAAKVSTELSRQRIVDLAVVPGPRADTTPSAKRFYYRGKAGVNFEAADEDQILVRAAPQQIDRLLTELAEPDMTGDSVAMVAGPVAVQGVEKSRNLVQLLGEQPKESGRPESMKDDDRLASAKGAGPRESNGASPDDSPSRDGGMLEGLLRVVGVDPDLLSAGPASTPESAPPADQSAAEVASRDSNLGVKAVAAADSANRKAGNGERVPSTGPTTAIKTKPFGEGGTPALPPSPPPLVERRLKAVTESSRGSTGKEDRTPPGPESSEANVTVVVQIIERPKPVEPGKSAKPNSDRPPPSRSVN